MATRLSRDLIVDLAVRIGDAEGVDAVSMSRLGQELGVSAMSLYRYVGSKAELLASMAERVLADLDLAWAEQPGALDDWRSAVTRVVYGWADLVAIHPRTVGLIYTDRPATRADMMPAEVMLGAMLRGGFSPAAAARAFRTVVLFVDSVLLTAGLNGDAGQVDWQGLPADVVADLPGVRSAAPFVDAMTYREIFDFGVRLLVEGIGAAPHRSE